MSRNLRLSEVASLLGISVGKARELSKTDPAFPLISLGPRTNLVPEHDLAKYIESKKTGTARASQPECAK